LQRITPVYATLKLGRKTAPISHEIGAIVFPGWTGYPHPLPAHRICGLWNRKTEPADAIPPKKGKKSENIFSRDFPLIKPKESATCKPPFQNAFLEGVPKFRHFNYHLVNITKQV
jgi:hypothetical protein